MAGTGLASYIRVKKEATAGTKPTGAAYLDIPFTSEGLTKNFTRGVSSNISPARVRGGVYTTGISCGGPINGNITWENLDWLLLGAMGTVATPAVSDSAYTNTYTFSAWADTFPSFSIEVGRGDIPTGKIFQYVGCYVSELTLNFSATGDNTFAATIVAKDETSTATTGSDPEATAHVHASGDCISSTQLKAATLDIGVGAADAYCVQSASIKIAAPYETTIPCLGTAVANLPLPNGLVDVTGEFLIKFTDRVAYDAFLLQSDEAGGRICFEGGLIGSASKYLLDIRINKFRYDGPSVGLTEGPGTIWARVPWTAYGTGGSALTSEPIAIQTINTINGDTVL